jgi:Domain of unknown function (DUF4389)
MSTHPVTFEVDYEEKRSRLTTFFRLFFAIPHFIVLWFYGVAAGIVIIVAWFALVLTGRYPQGMYDFVAGFLRYTTYVWGYFYLGTDRYPPFSGSDTDYPVRLNIGPPKAQYSRAKAFFRIILAIPVMIINYAMQIVTQVGALIAWFAIVALGRQPRGLQDMIGLGLSYQQRSFAYFALLTEDWPPFTDDATGRVGGGPPYGGLPDSAAPAGAGDATIGAAAAPGPFAPPNAPEAPADAQRAVPAEPIAPAEPGGVAVEPPAEDVPAREGDAAGERPDDQPRGRFGPSSGLSGGDPLKP